jgi:hypothetical protein
MGIRHLHDVGDALVHAARGDAVDAVVLRLLPAPSRHLVEGTLHGSRDLVGVEDGPPLQVACGAAHRLDERALGAQKPFFVGIEHRHQRHLGDIEPFAQEVDPDEHIEPPEP